MKTLLKIIPILFLCGQAVASEVDPEKDGNWRRTFIFEGEISVTRIPNKIIIRTPAVLKECSSYTFYANSPSTSLIQPMQDGKIDIQMPLKEFSRQVAKLGMIIHEGIFNNWTKTFRLENGLTVVHTPKLLIFKKGEQSIEMSQLIFSPGLSVFETTSQGEGIVLVEMSIDIFREQINRLSLILIEE